MAPAVAKKVNERGDDLVARLQVEGPEREQEGIGPAGAADAVPGSREPRDLALQLRHFRSHDEPLPLDHAHDGGEHGVLDALVLGHEVEQRDVHGDWSSKSGRHCCPPVASEAGAAGRLGLRRATYDNQ